MTGKSRRPRSSTLMDDERDDMTQTYKNRLMVHDIHRVRELSALLEERRRYFDGQLGEVYRNAGVSSPNSSLPRLRALDSPPASASASDSNMTNMGILGHNDHLSSGGTIELQSARSYSVFADDEYSVADSFEYAETKARLGRNWSSSTLLGGTSTGQIKGSGGGGNNGHKYGERPTVAAVKDSIQTEMMRTTELNKKLKARRSSLPLSLESNLKRPIKKKILTKANNNNKTTTSSANKDKDKIGQRPEVNLQTIASSLLTKSNGYSDSSDDDDDEVEDLINASKLRLISSGGKMKTTNLNPKKKFSSPSHFSMTDTLNRMRKFDVSQDIKRTLGGGGGQLPSITRPATNGTKINLEKMSSLDYEVVGGAPRINPNYKSNNNVATTLMTKKSTGSSSKSSNLAPIIQDYSPRSSLSTLSGNYPRIAFSSLEKMYREEQGDRARLDLNSSSQLLWKPVPKIDMKNIFVETVGQVEPDYSHDFRYLNLLDSLVPCFETSSQQWEPSKNKQIDNCFQN